jgi:nitroreductase
VIDLASVDEVLATTRSVRRKLDFERPVEPDVIEECVALASQAPTGMNREAWRFLVVTDPVKKRGVAELYRRSMELYASARPSPLSPAQLKLADRMHEIPALILVCSEGRPATGNTAAEVAFYGSVLPAAWSLMLALRARGLGSTWTTVLLVHERETAELLGIPDDVTQTVLLPVAYTRDAVLRRADRKGPEQVTYWNAWGARRPSPD